MADLKPSDMLNEAMSARITLAGAGVMPFVEMDARMQVVQADALISIADSLARIAAVMGADHA